MFFHATIIEAADDSRRLDELRRRAMLAVCADGVACGVCDGCKKAKSFSHPDVTVLRADGAEIKVDQIRAARAELWIRPNEAARRVLIIDGAETMNANAQNALLSVLEQPPSDAVFILAADNADALLPTIRSRCHVARLGGFSQSVSDAARAAADALRRRDAPALAEATAPLSKLKAAALLQELYSIRAALRETLDVCDALDRALELADGGVSASQVTAYLIASVL